MKAIHDRMLNSPLPRLALAMGKALTRVREMNAMPMTPAMSAAAIRKR